MRERNIKKNFWLNQKENEELKQKCKKAKISESEYFRRIILDYEIREKPNEEFYKNIKLMRNISINLNQIARKANSLNFIDAPMYRDNANKLNEIILEIREKFLVDRKK